jgi:MFS transporter, DHA2 family, multidrug resistance protein
MFWPQIIRGLAIMFCLLPPTRLALGHLAPDRVPDASGLFNLMRNLGGAIGLALIDTVIYSRSEMHSAELLSRLQSGDAGTANFVGISSDMIEAFKIGPLDGDMQRLLEPLIENAAFTAAINDAWLVIAAMTIAALLCVPFARARLQTP